MSRRYSVKDFEMGELTFLKGKCFGVELNEKENCAEMYDISNGRLILPSEALILAEYLKRYAEIATDEEVAEINNSLKSVIEENELTKDLENMLNGEPSNKPKVKKKSNSINGFVYLIADDYGRIKIGKAKNIENRIKQFSILPFKPKLIHVIKTNDYTLTEKLLHEKYHHKRISGEWFDLCENDIRDIKKQNFSGEIKQSIIGDCNE